MDPARPCVAGIGASAGGFEVICQLLSAMPVDSGVAFVVVLHLDPTHVSLIAPLLQKHTRMPVQEATEGARLMPNHVYTVPSDRDVSVLEDRLCLSKRRQGKGLHLPVDRLFQSLAEACGKRAIGVVLSGSGSDGATGACAIAAQGGIVLVQDPSSADSDGMPRSALATGAGCKAVAVAQMPALICAYTRHPYVSLDDLSRMAAEDEKAVQALLKLVHETHGHDFTDYRRSTLLRRIQRRMSLQGIVRLSRYVSLLKRDAAELDALYRDFQIGVTQFFREPEAWTTLDAEAITPLVAAKARGEPLRIWIPGCSTGQEAYSLAMLILDRQRRMRRHAPVQIFATDTNDMAREVGRLGTYPAGIAKQMTAAQLRRYFTVHADGQHYCVGDELRACVVFGRQNMFADPPFGQVDLISCRNVLIYLAPALQAKVLRIFHFALREGGYLLLGSAESNGGRDDLFAPLSKKWRVFARKGPGRGGVLTAYRGGADARPGTLAALQQAPALERIAGIAQKLVMDRFAPAAVLVDAQGKALYFSGPTDDFLTRPRGLPTLDLLALVRDGLRSQLRTGLQQAVSREQPVDIPLAHMLVNGGLLPVQITVWPLQERDLSPLFLVVFRQHLQAAPKTHAKTRKRPLEQHLEQELLATRNELQESIARFEQTHEALRSSNESVLSSNEELRSLNEELESSKEELQSLNEELTTANQQLQAKVLELETSNADLHNLLSSSEIATLCLDRKFRIKWFSPATQDQFNLLPGDVGRPISDIISALGDDKLIASARAVLGGQPPRSHQLQVDNGRWYIRRTLPYRDATAHVSGVIVTYTDVTDSNELVRATQELQGDLTASRKTEHQMRKLSTTLALAEERERRVLAKDLHDDLGQLLAVIAIKAAGIQKLPMSPAMRTAVQDCVKAVELTNMKLRAMSLQLNPPLLERVGFASAVGWLADEMLKVYGLEVQVEDDGKPAPLDPAVRSTLFRSVQGLLMNVCQHAHTNAAKVTLVSTARQLTVTVSDAGAGFDSERLALADQAESSVGLLRMRERLVALGGSTNVRSAIGVGTIVELNVPILNERAATP